MGYVIDGSYSTQGWWHYWVTGPDGARSNDVWVAYVGNQGTMAATASAAYVMPDLSGSTSVFSLPSGDSNGVLDIGSSFTFAVDDRTGFIGKDYRAGGEIQYSTWYRMDGHAVSNGPSVSGTTASALTAKSGYGCATDPSPTNLVHCFSISLFEPPDTTAPAGIDPVALAMVTLGKQADLETDVLVYSRGDTSLHLFSLPDLRLKGTLQLNGISVGNDAWGGWQVATFGRPQIEVKAVPRADPTKAWTARIFPVQASSNIGIDIQPSLITGYPSEQLTANVTGSEDKQVTWAVEGVVGGDSELGTVTQEGLYTHGNGANFASSIRGEVTASSHADPTKISSAFVKGCIVFGKNCEMDARVRPGTAFVAPGRTQQFDGIVVYADDPTVDWLVNGIKGGNEFFGTVTPSGLYTAPRNQIESPAEGMTAFLSQLDRALVIIDLNTMLERRRVTIPGYPIRIAADERNGRVIVALADVDTGLSRFVAVDVLTGRISNIDSTTDMLATGLAVSPDGDWIEAAGVDMNATPLLQLLPSGMPPRYLFSVAKIGNGTVTSSDANISCDPDCYYHYRQGTQVRLTATPADNWLFTGWLGCDSTDEGTCLVSIEDARMVTASFAAAYPVTVSKTGQGVVIGGNGRIYCGSACSFAYAEGTQITLTATPGAGYTLASWSGCDNFQSNVCAVLVSSARNVSATFTLAQIHPLALVLKPASVKGGNMAVATLLLDQPAPAGSFGVAVVSDRPQSVHPPSLVVVPAGRSSLSFAVRTTPVRWQTAAYVRAIANGTDAGAALTLTTGYGTSKRKDGAERSLRKPEVSKSLTGAPFHQ